MRARKRETRFRRTLGIQFGSKNKKGNDNDLFKEITKEDVVVHNDIEGNDMVVKRQSCDLIQENEELNKEPNEEPNEKLNEEPVIGSQNVYGSTDRQENEELNKQENGKVRIKTYVNVTVIVKCDKQLNTIPTKIDSNGNEVVVFDEVLVAGGSKRCEMTVRGYFVGYRMSVNELRYNLRKMWSRICNLPLEAWTTNGISALASRVGKPMVMDGVTATTCKNRVGKVRYARVLVEVSTQKPLPDDIEIVYNNGSNESCPKNIKVEKRVSDTVIGNEEQNKVENKK
ncbi:RNA-directed DNA polymerase, eukaryota, reverse transcriptase zinc-binding domain protein [Tanacetum coccineum]